jgi:nitrate reductase alpha subunit
MPHLKIVERDYSKIYEKYISLGRDVRNLGMGAHGLNVKVDDFYDKMMEKPVVKWPTPSNTRCIEWNNEKFPSLEDALDAANIILYLAPETNGELAYRSFQMEEEKTGLKLTDLAEDTRDVRMSFADISSQPRRTLTTPFWSGNANNGRAYAAYVVHVEKLVPWRTLTGRQSLYLDHEAYIDFGENLPTYKSKMSVAGTKELVNSPDNGSMPLNLLTPHGKWHIHSTYGDTLRMLTMSRGTEPAWINTKDAEKLKIRDNDYVEVYNDNGVYVTRANVSARIKQGTIIVYHSPERTYMAKSKMRNIRGGGHNSLTRVRLNPVLLSGGYAQFSYGFNYWGPVAVNRDTFVYIKKMDGAPDW